MAHTPGPWKAEQDLHCGLHGHPNDWGIYAHRRIARVEPAIHRDPTDEEAANARLIAAAPELLAALVNLVNMQKGRETWPEVREAEAAFAKATGKAVPR